MYYLSGGSFHQNKFPVRFCRSQSVFPWLRLFYYLTDAFALDLFMSSTLDPHPLCRSSRSQIFFGIGVPRSFPHFALKHRCFPVKFSKLLRTFLFTEHLCSCVYVAFRECFFFYFSLAALSLLPYSHFVCFQEILSSIKSLLLYHYYNNNRIFHQDCCNRYDLL